jgi:hypothetical protein
MQMLLRARGTSKTADNRLNGRGVVLTLERTRIG